MQYSELTVADRAVELRNMVRQLESKAHAAERTIRLNEPIKALWKGRDTNRFQNAKQAVTNAENDLAELTIGLAVLRADLVELQAEIPAAAAASAVGNNPNHHGVADNVREFPPV